MLLKEMDRIVTTDFVKGSKSSLDGLIQRDVMEFTETKKHLIEKLEQISGSKISVEKRGGGSDANIASKYSLTLDGFGPFGDGDHTIHERALKNSFIERIKLVTEILRYHQKELKLI
jgi:glutamate carboxypeptidase